MGKRVLFVCCGNTCRSPMAAALAGARLGQSILAESAGIECGSGLPAACTAVKVMRERGLDISGHRSTDIEQVNLDEFDVIVAMSPSVARRLAHVPAAQLLVWDIADPYGGAIDVYRATAGAIERALTKLSSAIQ